MAEVLNTNWENCGEFEQCFQNAAREINSIIPKSTIRKVGITHNLEDRSKNDDYKNYTFLYPIYKSSNADNVKRMETRLISHFEYLLGNEIGGGGGSMPDDGNEFYVYLAYR